MKKSELKSIIQEELKSILKEDKSMNQLYFKEYDWDQDGRDAQPCIFAVADSFDAAEKILDKINIGSANIFAVKDVKDMERQLKSRIDGAKKSIESAKRRLKISDDAMASYQKAKSELKK